MGLEVGEVNPKVFALLGVIAVAAAGYMWYSQAYAPSDAARNLARSSMQTSAQTLDANKAKLDKKKNEINNQPKSDDSKAIAYITKTKQAIPRGLQHLTALQQVEDIAKTSGIILITDSIPSAPLDGSSTDGSSATSQTAVPQLITLEGHGTYEQLGVMLRRVQDTATVFHGKLYVPDRLLATRSLEIGNPASDSQSSSGSDSAIFGTGTTSKEPAIPKNHIKFTITIEYYADLTSTTSDGAAAVAGVAGADPTVAGAPGTASTGAATSGTGSGSSTAATAGGATTGTAPSSTAGGAAATTGAGAGAATDNGTAGVGTSAPAPSDTPASSG